MAREQIVIREETTKDYHAVERLAQEAFWNKYQQGCDEHYLVHILRDSEDYLPELSCIAVVDDEVVGVIMYSKAIVKGDENVYEIITFGPLCVKPEWQGCGIGECLLKETMNLAKQAGYPGIVIFGEPDYYPRIGFKTCEQWGITTPDGKNFDAFMGYELIEGAMKNICGKFYESDIFKKLNVQEVEKFNQNFPLMNKQFFPKQW